jgi:RimJ/RimL family protein N-acetyltransferase
MGAVRETVLRNSFAQAGEHLDQVLWSILRRDWRRLPNFWGTSVH